MRLYYACRVDDWRGRSHLGNREHRQTEIPRRGTGRAGERTFPADLSRRDVPRSRRRWTAMDGDSSEGGYVPIRTAITLPCSRSGRGGTIISGIIFSRNEAQAGSSENIPNGDIKDASWVSRAISFEPPRLNLPSNLACVRELGKAFGTCDTICEIAVIVRCIATISCGLRRDVAWRRFTEMQGI